MTTIGNAFLMYERLQNHLKAATHEHPLTIHGAFIKQDIHELGVEKHNIATAMNILAKSGVVAKIEAQIKEFGGHMSRVAYYWIPEKKEEPAPEMGPTFGLKHLSRKKPRRTGEGTKYASQMVAVAQPSDVKLDLSEGIVPRRSVEPPVNAYAKVQQGIEELKASLPQPDGIVLNFGGQVFTAPKGSKVDVHTAADGLVVTFTLPPTGN